MSVLLYFIICIIVYIIYFKKSCVDSSCSKTVPQWPVSSKRSMKSIAGLEAQVTQSLVLWVACTLGSVICPFFRMALISLLNTNFVPRVLGTVVMPDKPFPSVVTAMLSTISFQ